jgi:endonuclease-3
MVKKVTDPVHAGRDEATLKLVEKLKNEDCSTHVKSPNDKLSSANARKQKSSSNKLSSALKNLKSVLDEPITGTRKRKSVTTTGFLLPSAKRQLVIKSEKSTKTSSSSSSTSKKDSNKASLKKIPDPNPNKLSSISSKNTDKKKKTLNRCRESTNGNKKSSSSTSKKHSKKDDQTMKDNPVMTDSYRSVVKGSPHFKEYRNAPPEPVNSQILQNKVTRYRVIINSEWINQQVYMLMEINRLVTQIRRTRKVVAPRELWLKAIPTNPSHPNYPYQLLFIMICSSALSDATLTKRMKSIFDLIKVEPEEIIKMSVGELERMLHGMGTSNENAANILSMTKDVLDNHDGKVPADWNTITKFHGVGRKIASVVMYEAFGISRVPVDIHVLKFARYFGWCSDKAEAKSCQEDIEGWMPEIYWHLVNSTIGSFCQLAASHEEILYPEMKRMRIGLINHKFDMQRFLKKYVEQMESKKVTKPKA